ncbi:MAG: hypothetical protein LCH63_20675 [Candidatus Melainabacteria bacterium]|nr:hypothetical protein [Candidatus Melainabacteria bacterium]
MGLPALGLPALGLPVPVSPVVAVLVLPAAPRAGRGETPVFPAVALASAWR